MIKYITLCLFAACLLAGCRAQETESQSSSVSFDFLLSESQPDQTLYSPVDLGIPYQERYAAPLAMTPYDLILYKGCLYVASGDWGGNAGPVEMLCYDTAQEQWKSAGTLPDEEVYRFFVIEGILVTPGIDPREGWEWGNLYFLYEEGWQTKRTIPGGVHCFDLAYRDGVLFAAVTVNRPGLHAAVSFDMGESFNLVPLLKDGSLVTDTEHYFDLFVIAGEIYACCVYDLYRFDGTSFVYETTWQDRVTPRYYNTPTKMRIFSSECVLGDTLYFTTGNFYACTSPEEVRQIPTPAGERAYDIVSFKEKLYLLCDLKTEEGYSVTVYRFLPETEEFLAEVSFQSDIPAISLAIDENGYYFGLASNNYKNQNHGRILKIEKND